MKKYLNLSLLLVLASAQSLTAQRELIHGLGMNGGIVHNPVTETGFTASVLCYYPRYNFHHFSEEVSLSISSALGLGIASSTTDKVTFGVEIPIFLEFNFAYGASLQSDNHIGGSLALGWAYNNASTSLYSFDAATQKETYLLNRGIFGPMLCLNVRALHMYQGSPGQFGLYTIFDVNNGNRLFGIRYNFWIAYKEYK